MIRCKLALSLLFIGLIVGLGWTQQPPQKGNGPKPKEAVPAEPEGYQDDLKILRQNGLKGEGPDILDYFRKRTLKQPDPKEIAALIKQLGDEDFPVREKAFTALATMGTSALAGLKESEKDASLEVRKRVADLKQRIDTKAEPTLQAAASRVLTKVKPEGAADVLMAFLPFASDPIVIDEIGKTLGAVAVKEGKVEPVLIKSLEDPIAVKRGAAGEALALAGVKDQFANVKKLYTDKDLAVRLRVGMAMMSTHDQDAVPVLIDLMGELTPIQLWPVEESLSRLAGEKTPEVSLGHDAASRKICRDAWSKWYAANAKTIDMAKLGSEDAYLGYTLIVKHNNRGGIGGNQGEVYELDKEKNVRWKIQVPNGYPVDAQVLGGNRVLIAEWQAARVTERDLKGEVKWEFNCGGNPFTVQRLRNGNTFIATQGRLMEIDRNKTEVWHYQRPNNDIMRAKKLPNGEVAFVTNLGIQATYQRIDPKNQNKVVKQFQVTAVQMIFGCMDVLPNGHVLIAHYHQRTLTEYNENGGQVSTQQFNNQLPSSVVRLPNGNNLVGSYSPGRVTEFKGNQAVWEHQVDGLVFVTRRR